MSGGWTPAPWSAQLDGKWRTASVQTTEHGFTFVVANVPHSKRFEQDTRLIAAAPDLYEALDAIHQMLWGRPDIVKALRPLMGPAENAASDKAAAAMRKARGQ